ncbi:TerB family tellurite resistance protein [Mesonia sp. K7]|uniref:tellurite resistance TerB family protein n=1 Tax=Mesonia sp. K7 TaxID=2218606 RepID=UPI000DA7FE0A|nr:TerB family tellurite resistance protein [Mesonia sp. K7]PZD78490.1 TerB family tellurite resistance protein [Mesonia sp. K7]
MSFSDLFYSGEHRRNLAHFAAIVTLATVDGAVNPEEEKVLQRLATKLDITETEYKEVMKKPDGYPINPPNSKERRLERLYDLLMIIYADHNMDEQEAFLLKRYAIGLGFSSEDSQKIVNRSIQIMSGKIPFDDYIYLLNKKD